MAFKVAFQKRLFFIFEMFETSKLAQNCSVILLLLLSSLLLLLLERWSRCSQRKEGGRTTSKIKSHRCCKNAFASLILFRYITQYHITSHDVSLCHAMSDIVTQHCISSLTPVIPEKTHLPCQGKHHCTAVLRFVCFGLH